MSRRLAYRRRHSWPLQELHRELKWVLVGRGHNDELDGRIASSHGGAVRLNAWVALCGIVGVTLDDGGQFKTFHGRDQRRVKDAPASPKPTSPTRIICSLGRV